MKLLHTDRIKVNSFLMTNVIISEQIKNMQTF